MAGYIIKGIYLTGKYAGEIFFVDKTGKVTRTPDDQFDFKVYKNAGRCQYRCRQMFEDNERYRERSLKRPETYMVGDRIRYEPYKVANVHPSDI